MACKKPIVGYQRLDGGALTFGKEPPNARSVTIPCGQCLQCRLGRSAEWGIRAEHERQLHEESCFLTLTYSNDKLPKNGSLDKTHLQKFFKRLRHHMGPFRHLACGEYGEETQRAHYHACIFGLDFHDKIHFRRIGEHNLYISDELNKLWGHGNTSVGSLTFQSAAYTASYTLKLITGKKRCPRYVEMDDETGELLPLQQPFMLVSNGGNKESVYKGGIGAGWINQFHRDVYGHDMKDFVVMKTKKVPVPKYYDKIYDTIDSDHMAWIKGRRVREATPLNDAQLHARASVAHARMYRKVQV